jgi:hypothetical protein
MGVYRATLEERGGDSRSFRLLLYAAPPDRIHGEILSPVGTTEVIIDGGGGRLAVAVMEHRLAYVGEADAASLQKVLGVALSLESLVGGLLGSASPDGEGYRVRREPSVGSGLPRRLILEGERRRVDLRLKRLAPLSASTEALGNGQPPAGMETRPLPLLDEIVIPDADGGAGG